jgi:hypothetical protein
LQLTGEFFSPQKRTFSIKKLNFLTFFLSLWVIFALLGPDKDPGAPLNPDPDPQHWYLETSYPFLCHIGVVSQLSKALCSHHL